MGKASRKKKPTTTTGSPNGVDKRKAHKERQLERRQRAIAKLEDEDSSNSDSDNDGFTEDTVIRLHSRVWYRRNQTWGRGIVKEIDKNILRVLPVESPGNDRNEWVTVHHNFSYQGEINNYTQSAFLDRYPWSTRFKKGDKVLAVVDIRQRRVSEEEWVWFSVTITDIWWAEPSLMGYPVHPYRVSCPVRKKDINGVVEESIAYHIVKDDNDNYIRALPALRFHPGDQIVVSSKALSRAKNENSIHGYDETISWLSAEVIDRGSWKSMRPYLTVYECRRTHPGHHSKRGGKRNGGARFFIEHDTDEYIAPASSTPRERLMDAIDHRCNCEHLVGIVASAGLDVSAFQDLLLDRAIEAGSFEAIVWLKEHVKVDMMTTPTRLNGRGLLHQIASSSNAHHFFEQANEADSEQFSKLDWYNDNGQWGLLCEDNFAWLHEVVLRERTRALDAVLAPGKNLWWQLHYSIDFFGQYLDYDNKEENWCDELFSITEDRNGRSIKDVAEMLQRYTIVRMIEGYAYETLLFGLYQTLRFHRHRSDISILRKIDLFSDEQPSSFVPRLLQFCSKNEPHTRSLVSSIFRSLVKCWSLRMFKWFIGGYPKMLHMVDSRATNADMNEFWQAETIDFDNLEPMRETMNFVSLVAHGDTRVWSSIRHRENLRFYTRWLQLRRVTVDSRIDGIPSDLATALETAISELDKEEPATEILEFKLRLLRDDDDLEKRIQFLEYLVREVSMKPPNSLDVVRWRQCGILRWLISQNHISLGGPAWQNEQIVERSFTLRILNRGSIPRSLLTEQLLCFACVEFDDLQTLQWLVSVKNVSTLVECSGRNLLHVCAEFCRTEIAEWLVMRTPSLIEAPYKRLFAPHLAIRKGFVSLADFLLEAGGPTDDLDGKTIVWHAKQSRMEYVRVWGKEKEKPLLLQNKVQKLLRLLEEGKDLNAIKNRIIKTECLRVEVWCDTDWDTFDAAGPCGLSYMDIVMKCFDLKDVELTLWLCQELSPREVGGYQFTFFWGEHHNSPQKSVPTKTNGKICSISELQAMAKAFDNPLLQKCFSGPWTKRIRCKSDFDFNPVLSHASSLFPCGSKVSEALDTFRKKWKQDSLMEVVLSHCKEEMYSLLINSGDECSVIADVEDLLGIVLKLASEIAGNDRARYERLLDGWVFSHRGIFHVNKEVMLPLKNHHPVEHLAIFLNQPLTTWRKVFIIWAYEGYGVLIRWSLSEARNGWNAVSETLALRIASYCGHASIIQLFLSDDSRFSFFSSRKDRLRSAMLGATESGRLEEMKRIARLMDIRRLPMNFLEVTTSKDPENNAPNMKETASSIAGAAMFGCMVGNITRNFPASYNKECLVWLTMSTPISTTSLLQAARHVVARAHSNATYESVYNVVKFLVDELGLNVWNHQADLVGIGQTMVNRFVSARNDNKEVTVSLLRWLELLTEDFGIPIDILDLSGLELEFSKADVDAKAEIDVLKQKQRDRWMKFDSLKRGESLEEVQKGAEYENVFLSSRDSQGLQLVHLAAAYNRVDVIEWLGNKSPSSLSTMDGRGRSVLQIAEESNALTVAACVKKKLAEHRVGLFVSSHFRRRVAWRNTRARLKAVVTLQAMRRGNKARRHCRTLIESRFDSRRFQAVWGGILHLLKHVDKESRWKSWSAIQEERFNMFQDEDEHVEDPATSEALQDALSSALLSRAAAATEDEEQDVVPNKQDASNVHSRSNSSLLAESQDANNWKVNLSADVLKWLKRQDQKYCSMFVRCVERLGAGERSYALEKRLKGTKKMDVFETKLDRGQRILWTSYREDNHPTLLIWYVAKHDNISRLLQLIDKAEDRTNWQNLVSADAALYASKESQEPEVVADSSHVFPDPKGNTPLKLYTVESKELQRLEIEVKTWTPPLRLTREERETLEKQGAVLLLGRSGTGKTICICNRMSFDWQMHDNDHDFSQLFVARSHRIAEYVRQVVNGANGSSGDDASIKYFAFSNLVGTCEKYLSTEQVFLRSQRMTFARFKREIYQRSTDVLDALVIWTQIRSFIKGSIEAVNKGCSLSQEEYLTLGSNRCRLTPEQRVRAYAAFERYQGHLDSSGLWDDCDRIAALHMLIQSTDVDVLSSVSYSRVYVDEIQDYTQAEIAIFFLLCTTPGGFFFAGDTAQSVVEGIEFRFEEVRSVGYHFFKKSETNDKRYIPDKPLTVNLNFRSHSGILEIAAAVLERMLTVFPRSANKLPPDQGMFLGPRPVVLYHVATDKFSELVSKIEGVVILTHQGDVPRLQALCPKNSIVLSIADAKGLEFPQVLVVDFFKSLGKEHQKPWRELLFQRDSQKAADVQPGFPEIETHLKLLYTAITRCSQRLYFAETEPSFAGQAFVRWATTTSTTGRARGDGSGWKGRSTEKGKSVLEALAVRQEVADIEHMSRTVDEWLSAGVEYAKIAEQHCDDHGENGGDDDDGLARAEYWLDRAIHCFECGKDDMLSSKARAHRSAIRFRLGLRRIHEETFGDPDDRAENAGPEARVPFSSQARLEVDASEVLRTMVVEGLLAEAKRLFEHVMPMMTEYSRERLSRELLPLLLDYAEYSTQDR